MGSRAGILAGVAGFATFLVLHAGWIVAIWQIAPVGTVFAAGIGAVVGHAVEMLVPSSTRTPVATLGVFAAAVAVLGPAVIVAELGARAGAAPLPIVLAGLFGSSALVGAALGSLVGRTRRAAGRAAVAAALMAAGPGHNIPMLASTPSVTLELALLLIVLLVSTVVFVASRLWLVAGRRGGQSARSGVGEGSIL